MIMHEGSLQTGSRAGYHVTVPTAFSPDIIQDRRTNPSVRIMPVIDAQQDWNFVSGSQIEGLTTLEFFRFLDTGDTAGDLLIGEVQ